MFPGGPYRELEISKDFSMSTGNGQNDRVFVSHFDQTFSVIPEAKTSLSSLGLAAMAGYCFIRRRAAAAGKA